MFLPPKGKYFNPIELSFGTLKGHIRGKCGRGCESKRTKLVAFGTKKLTTENINFFIKIFVCVDH